MYSLLKIFVMLPISPAATSTSGGGVRGVNVARHEMVLELTLVLLA